MPLLKMKEHDEEKERKFTLQSQRRLTVEERFQMLFEKANQPKRIKIFEKAGHAEEVYKKYSKEFIQVTEQWFEETLNNSKPRGVDIDN